MEPVLLVDARDGWVKLTLNRPTRLNAFDEALHVALAEALDDIAANDAVRAVLLTGAGRGFCAGQDLSAVPTAPDGRHDLGSVVTRFYNPLIMRLRRLERPIVCAVNGVAAGAGANIAFACDIVLAARSAKFIQAFAKIGLVPDSGGTWTLPRLVGDARARALMMLGEPVTAEQAEAWGAIWKVCDDDALMAEAERLTAHLATQPTFALGQTKRLLNGSSTTDLADQLDGELDAQRACGATPDYTEGVAAFTEKRTPRFTGRAK